MRLALGAALLALMASCAPGFGAPGAHTAPALVFLDNDFLGPAGSNIQSVLPLLRPDVRVLGIGVVTGDAWRDEEMAHLLRFLEIARHAEIPVFPGAEMPLLRNQAEMATWEARYGRIVWKGAWNAPKPGRTYHPDQPGLIPPLPEGAPTLRASDQDAVSFLVGTIRAHPHQVTIIAAGPLTDIALALRIAPDIAGLAKQLVFMGGMVDPNMGQATGNADYNTDFNLLFDPEAAHIVLTAPWARVTAVGTVANGIVMTPALADRIGQSGTPVDAYIARYARRGQPMWDELTAAIAVDPTLVKTAVAARMDVDLTHGPNYGSAHLWPQSVTVSGGADVVHVVQSVEAEHFVEGFVAATR